MKKREGLGFWIYVACLLTSNSAEDSQKIAVSFEETGKLPKSKVKAVYRALVSLKKAT